ncbi:hypothetical protein Tco_1176395 [Tanacetum coccineum]
MLIYGSNMWNVILVSRIDGCGVIENIVGNRSNIDILDALRSLERKKSYVKELERKSRYYEEECRRLESVLQCFMAENQAPRFSLHSSTLTSNTTSITKHKSQSLLGFADFVAIFPAVGFPATVDGRSLSAARPSKSTSGGFEGLGFDEKMEQSLAERVLLGEGEDLRLEPLRSHAGKTYVITAENISALTYGLLGAFLQTHGGRVRHSTSASGSQPAGNTKNDRIPQPPYNDCMSSDNLCVSNAVNVVKSRAKLNSINSTEKIVGKPTGRCRSGCQQPDPTQKSFMIRHRHGKMPYEPLHDKPPDLSYLHVFGALCYRNNIERIWQSGTALHEMTPVSISSGLVPNPPSSTPFVPPTRTDWDLLFQPMFDESPNVDVHAPEVIAPIPEAVAAGTCCINCDVEEDNHDIEVAHMGNDPYSRNSNSEVTSNQSASFINYSYNLLHGTPISDQIAFGDALVAPADRLKLEKCNLSLSFGYHIQGRQPLNVVYDVQSSLVLQGCPSFLLMLQRSICTNSGLSANIETKSSKKGSAMYYPRFTKLVVNYVMEKDPSIPRRNKVNWHYARDDPMFSTINVISRNEATQLYGAILPVALTNEDIRNSESYKEYYAMASGTIPPKTKGSKKKANTDAIPKLKSSTAPKKKKSGTGKQKTSELENISEADLTEAEQLKIVIKRSRQETHSSHASGSGADEGTGVTPGVPDAPDYDSEDDISWKSSDDEQDDEQAQDDDDTERHDIHETTQEEEDE